MTAHPVALIQVAAALESLGAALRAWAEGEGTPAGAGQKPEAAVSPTEAVPGAAPEPAGLSLEQVRARLARLSRAGFTDEIRDIFADMGFDRLSEVPAGSYGELMDRARKLGR